jgi:hypothetical protein
MLGLVDRWRIVQQDAVTMPAIVRQGHEQVEPMAWG